MLFQERQKLEGVALSEVEWPTLTPLPNLGRLPLIEYFEIGPGLRGFYDAFLRQIGLTADATGYRIALQESQDPKQDGFFSQTRIWWEVRNEEQTKLLGDFIWDFMKREQKWYREMAETRDMMVAIYGTKYIYTHLFLAFGLMRESRIHDGIFKVEYRIWSFPKLTED